MVLFWHEMEPLSTCFYLEAAQKRFSASADLKTKLYFYHLHMLHATVLKLLYLNYFNPCDHQTIARRGDNRNWYDWLNKVLMLMTYSSYKYDIHIAPDPSHAAPEQRLDICSPLCNVHVQLSRRTFAAFPSGETAFSHLLIIILWRVIMGRERKKKKNFCHHILLLCQQQFSNSDFVNTDYRINNSSLHMI